MQHNSAKIADELAVYFGTVPDSDFSRAQRFAIKLEQLVRSTGDRHSFARISNVDGTRDARVVWCVHAKSQSLSVGDKLILAGGGVVDVGTVRTRARDRCHLIEWLRSKTVTWEIVEPLVSAQEFVLAARRAAILRAQIVESETNDLRQADAYRSAFLASLPTMTRSLNEICVGVQLMSVGMFIGLYGMTVGTLIGLGQDLWELVPAGVRRRGLG